MGLVITPLERPRRFNPLAQPLEAPQKLGGRDLVWRFDGGDITSDGGALVLKKLEERTGIVRRFAACFTDYRSPQQIEHPLLDLVAQRVFGLALGYEDLNDHDELRRDPMLAVALGKDDVKGEQRRRAQDRGKALAGKSTLNRLELTAPDYGGSPRQKDSDKPETKKIVVDPESIDALLVDLFMEAHEQAPERIILDLARRTTSLSSLSTVIRQHYNRTSCCQPRLGDRDATSCARVGQPSQGHRFALRRAWSRADRIICAPRDACPRSRRGRLSTDPGAVSWLQRPADSALARNVWTCCSTARRSPCYVTRSPSQIGRAHV